MEHASEFFITSEWCLFFKEICNNKVYLKKREILKHFDLLELLKFYRIDLDQSTINVDEFRQQIQMSNVGFEFLFGQLNSTLVSIFTFRPFFENYQTDFESW